MYEFHLYELMFLVFRKITTKKDDEFQSRISAFVSVRQHGSSNPELHAS